MISDADPEFNKGWKPFSEDAPWQDLSFFLHQMKVPSFPGLKMKTQRFFLL